MGEPDVTVIVVPRERFSAARRSLESVIDNTTHPHRLVYFLAGAPPALSQWVREQAAINCFKLREFKTFLHPNHARNLGLDDVDTPFVAFLDNDVVVRPGWLEALVRCAQETAADIVGPATLIGADDSAVVHLLGGDLTWEGEGEQRRLTEQHRFAHEIFGADLLHGQRTRCDLAEFHGMLVRRRVFDELGMLDGKLRVAQEHTDLCLGAGQAGMSVWYEPASVITYLTVLPLQLADAPFYKLRWDRDLFLKDHAHFARKWRLDPSSSAIVNCLRFGVEQSERLALPDPARARAQEVGTRPAQTPAQFYRQLSEVGGDDVELSRARRTCELAVSIYAGLHRACGTPFLCHGIGTASILLAHGAPLNLALAGLLHAAYSHGLFDADAAGPNPGRRRRIEAAAGQSVERLVRRYHAFDWSQRPPADTVDLDTVPCEDAEVHLMRIANDLDEQLDLALAITRKPLDPLATWRPYFRRLTAYLGIPGLAAAFDRAIETTRHARVPVVLRNAEGTSYLIDETSRTKVHPNTRRSAHGLTGDRPVPDDLTVIVHGNRRRQSLHFVLEGLRRQNALPITEVWLDGHDNSPELIKKVEACGRLERLYPQARWVKKEIQETTSGMLISSLGQLIERHGNDAPNHKIVVLEDDCFPAQNALAMFDAELDAITADPEIFSVYGHHFGDPLERDSEDGTTTAFQCWGWGTTVSKLRPIHEQLARLWTMPVAEYRRWIDERMTPALREQMDRFPGRSSTEQFSRNFCWDSTVAFLVVRTGMRHRATAEQVVYNFGAGADSLNFGRMSPQFLEPPYNMISEEELVARFALPPDPEDTRLNIELGRRYEFGSGSDAHRLLGLGWSIPEPWGIWSEGLESVIRFRAPASLPRFASLQVLLEINPLAYSDASACSRVLEVAVEATVRIPGEARNRFPSRRLENWTLKLEEYKTGLRMPLRFPADILPAAPVDKPRRDDALIELRLRYEGAVSPAELGVSEDRRVLAIGLVAMEIELTKAP